MMLFKRSTSLRAAAMTTMIWAAGPNASAQDADRGPVFDVRAHYDKADYMVPMRDGTRLFTIVYTPKDASRTYPILLTRTPYSIPPYGPDEYREVLGPSAEFDRDGYIFAFQDVRGKFRSEGEFQVIKPLRAGETGVDESTDNYDAIEWLLGNLPNHNGRVGQWGISYPGWQTVMGMVDAHPALKASSPQASPSDMFIGDDWHHNGAFRLMYAFSWLASNARTRSGPTEQGTGRFDYGTNWGYRFFLESGTLSDITERYFQDRVPAWTEFMAHGTYDEYWQRQNALLSLSGIEYPILNVAGWFDAEDFYGPMSIYYTLETENPVNQSTLVVGPWRHGGWRSMDGDSLGCVEFGSKTSHHFQQAVQYPFFSYYLKDQGQWSSDEAIVFETGSNVWKTYDRWPPQAAEPTAIYFHPNGTLSFEPPASDTAEAFDSYVSDPDKPVPFSSEIRTTQGHLWMIEDQRFASTRPDVLVYQTDVLTEDITIAGPIIASLFASTSGADSDWIVKMIDVYPGDAVGGACDVPMSDFQMLLAGEVFRGKFRNSYSDPAPMVPGEVTAIEFDLRDRYHTFKAGHRIMVQVQSTWFPVIDRNPQTFVDIYQATQSDFQKATQRIYRSGEFPSHLTVRVLKRED